MFIKNSRIEDQRSFLPLSGGVRKPLRQAPTMPDDDFFSLVLKYQSNRLEDQVRSVRGQNWFFFVQQRHLAYILTKKVLQEDFTGKLQQVFLFSASQLTCKQLNFIILNMLKWFTGTNWISIQVESNHGKSIPDSRLFFGKSFTSSKHW